MLPVAAPSTPAPSPFRGRNGVTAEERDRPRGESERLLRLERRAREAAPAQLDLFAPGPHGSFGPLLGGLAPLVPRSALPLARAWYRRELEQAGRPPNTVESYGYDLAQLEDLIGPKPIADISRRDIADFLGAAKTRVTRKRRLTTARRFFRFLIDDAKVLRTDPTDGFFPHPIPLRTPVPLFAAEQEALLAAAVDDEPWALPAILLMMRLGLGRAELLALRREHVDLADPERPVVYVFYEQATRREKERKLAGDAAFAAAYRDYLEAAVPVDVLFPFGPPAVNAMVERVRKGAGIAKAVTPQTLRHTFAVDRATAGASADDLLALLGLADDPRNRESVGRYLKLAAAPL